MKALVYTGKEGLSVKEIDAPVAGPGRAVLRIRNCGICGSDLFLLKSGGFPDGAVPGHEFSGVIEELGPGVEGFSVGELAIARPAGCGECKWCAKKMENICVRRRALGFGQRKGGFSEFLLADADMLIRVPDGLSSELAALTDQFATALHGMKVVNFQPGENVLVTGAGPIGLCAIMLLKHAGAGKIIVSEVNPDRVEIAKRLGADEVLSPIEKGFVSAVNKSFGDAGMDIIIECSGTAEATQQAIQISPVGCRISLVGMCVKPVTFIPFAVFQKHLTIIGSFGNSQTECREVLDIMASGSIPAGDIISRRVTLDELPEVFAQLMKAKDELKVMMGI